MITNQARAALAEYLMPAGWEGVERLERENHAVYAGALAAYEQTWAALASGRVPRELAPRKEEGNDTVESALADKAVCVAISGKMGTGKTSLLRKVGLPIASIGDGIKEETAAVLAVRGFEWLTVDHVRLHKDVFRLFLQEFAEAKRIVLGKDWYVRRMVERTSNWRAVGCDDVRMRGEADVIARSGFTLVRLEAPLDVRLSRLRSLYPSITEAHLNYVSETDLDNYPFEHVFDATLPLSELAQALVATL